METPDNSIELTPENMLELQLRIRHFFVEYPQDELKKIIWELFTAWICNSAEHAMKEQIVNMLVFYEDLLRFTSNVGSYCEHLDKTVLADILNK